MIDQQNNNATKKCEQTMGDIANSNVTFRAILFPNIEMPARSKQNPEQTELLVSFLDQWEQSKGRRRDRKAVFRAICKTYFTRYPFTVDDGTSYTGDGSEFESKKDNDLEAQPSSNSPSPDDPPAPGPKKPTKKQSPLETKIQVCYNVHKYAL